MLRIFAVSASLSDVPAGAGHRDREPPIVSRSSRKPSAPSTICSRSPPHRLAIRNSHAHARTLAPA
jgi:hypothetical protein